jgi:hypothetical protein
MSYIGNEPTSVAFLTDTFSGNGSTTAFTLSAAPAGTSSILVAITGVVQDPSTYSVVGTTLTFSPAPPTGTGNISVRFLGIPASGVTTTAYRTVTEFTATAGQTTFSVPSYTVGFIDVYRNGVMLGSADYTASNGVSVVLASGATAGDLVEVISFQVSSVLNAIPNSPASVGTSNIANGVTINFADGSASTPSITNDGDTNTGMFFPAADTIAFAEGGAEVARFDSSGNLGIGTSSPTSKLDVTGAISLNNVALPSAGTARIYSRNTDSSLYIQSGSGNTTYLLDGSQNTMANFGSSLITFATGNTERMRIDGSGNVLIKTTNTSQSAGAGVKLNAVGTCYIVGSGVDTFSHYDNVANGYKFYVGANGLINSVFTSISAISDQRFKENVSDLDDGLDAVMALKPRKFDWKTGKGKDIKGDRGFIAQEFETVFPDLVDEWKDPAPEGEAPYKSVRADLIPTLVKAIQELKAEVDSLKAEVTALKGAE